MNPILRWITAACILAPVSLGAPQLFPFSSLSSYFDQRTRNGPGGAQSGAVPRFIDNGGTSGTAQSATIPQLIANIGTANGAAQLPQLIANIGNSNAGERFPRNHLPANHRPASLTDLHEQVATPVGYEIIIPHRIRQDSTNTQAVALQSYLPQNIFNPPPQNQKPLVYYPEATTTKPEPKVETETSPPPSVPPTELLPPSEEEPEDKRPTEKLVKNHAYPKKWQPEPPKKKKTSANSLTTAKEKRDPGKQQLPPVGPPRGVTEQEAAETGFAGVTAGLRGLGSGGEGGAGGDRVQFQMHGLQGPHSYKFGYDTGKGKNRQFRYEERDNKGHVRGHYGFYNKHGKLQVVNYEAHPEHGFRADSNFAKHSAI